MTLPANKIHNSAVILKVLEDLSPSKLKKGDFTKALQVLYRLGNQFQSLKELSPISQGRVSFIGDWICENLIENKSLPNKDQIGNLLLDLVNLRNAMLLEALFFGILYPKIATHSRLSGSPLFTELQMAIPKFLDKIKFTHNATTDEFIFIIETDPIDKFFDSQITESLSDNFSIFIVLFFSYCRKEGNTIIIPIQNLPDKKSLEPFLNAPNLDCRLIAQILYVCCLEAESMYLNLDVLGITNIIFQYLEQPVPSKTTKYCFDEYLTKRLLIPLFSIILEERNLNMERGIPCRDILSSPEFFSRINPYIQEDWLEEATDAYDLIRKIELNLKRLFPPGSLAKQTELAFATGFDPRLLELLHYFAKNLNLVKHLQPYPDPLTTLQGSTANFQLVPFYTFYQKNWELAAEERLKREKDEVSSSAKKTRGKKKPQQTPSAQASTPTSEYEEPYTPLHEDDVDLSTFASLSMESDTLNMTQNPVDTTKSGCFKTPTPYLPLCEEITDGTSTFVGPSKKKKGGKKQVHSSSTSTSGLSKALSGAEEEVEVVTAAPFSTGLAKKKQTDFPSAVIGESASWAKASSTALKAKEELPASIASAAGSLAVGIAPTTQSLRIEAIEKSRSFLRGILLAPRVAVWNHSPQAGLTYYRYGEDASHILSAEAMVLQHRFPPQILSILFSDYYSKKSSIQKPHQEICDCWESILEIDAKKYVLEATVDSRGILFHYYARPLKRYSDYFHLTKESPSEFPYLSEKEGMQAAPLPKINLDGIQFDPQGNAYFKFDGHSYKMLILKTTSS